MNVVDFPLQSSRLPDLNYTLPATNFRSTMCHGTTKIA
jgi:hypothetical protein